LCACSARLGGDGVLAQGVPSGVPARGEPVSVTSLALTAAGWRETVSLVFSSDDTPSFRWWCVVGEGRLSPGVDAGGPSSLRGGSLRAVLGRRLRARERATSP
jgi:hypothetical protein